MIKFRHSRDKTSGSFGAYDDDDDKHVGLLHWATGEDAGWFFSPESNLTDQVWIAPLDVDLEKVMQLCREKLTSLAVVTMMPHQDAVARLLHSSWYDVGFSCDWPVWSWLTATERACIGEQQLLDVARWVAPRVKVIVIRRTDGTLVGEELRDKRGSRDVITYATRELAEEILTKLGCLGTVEEITVAALIEACRA